MAGYLSAWFDWSADGDFSDLGEQVATDVLDGVAGDTDGTVNGTILLPITPASSASLAPSTARKVWMRMRFSKPQTMYHIRLILPSKPLIDC